jgi:hypothetical protein
MRITQPKDHEPIRLIETKAGPRWPDGARHRPRRASREASGHPDITGRLKAARAVRERDQGSTGPWLVHRSQRRDPGPARRPLAGLQSDPSGPITRRDTPRCLRRRPAPARQPHRADDPPGGDLDALVAWLATSPGSQGREAGPLGPAPSSDRSRTGCSRCGRCSTSPSTPVWSPFPCQPGSPGWPEAAPDRADDHRHRDLRTLDSRPARASSCTPADRTRGRPAGGCRLSGLTRADVCSASGGPR